MDERRGRSIEGRVIALEVQMKQVITEMQSEIAERERRSFDIETRLRSVEKSIWLAAGAFIAIQVLLKFL